MGPAIELDIADAIERALKALYCVGEQTLADTVELLHVYRLSQQRQSFGLSVETDADFGSSSTSTQVNS